MEIQLEFLVVIILAFVFIGFAIVKKIQPIIDRRRYKIENDKGRLAEEKRRKIIAEFEKGKRRYETGDTGVKDSPFDIPGQTGADERIPVPSEIADDNGKDGSSDGKTRRKFRNPFRRNREKGGE